MQIITLSHDIYHHSPVHPALQIPEIKQNTFISRGDGYNSFFLNIENHSGTHVDAPAHFLKDGNKISDYKMEELVFIGPKIIDVPKGKEELVLLEDIQKFNLDNIDALFFKTGFESLRYDNPDEYINKNPGVSPEVVDYIRRYYPKIRCLGVDSISISSSKYPELGREAHINAFKVHNNFGKSLLLLEDMKLAHIKNDRLNKVIIIPWQILDVDSAPCTVLAEIID